jgi:hypothetical protein
VSGRVLFSERIATCADVGSVLARGGAAPDASGLCDVLTVGGTSWSLDADGDAVALFGGDEVVGVLGVVSDVDLHSVDTAGEPAGHEVSVLHQLEVVAPEPPPPVPSLRTAASHACSSWPDDQLCKLGQ